MKRIQQFILIALLIALIPSLASALDPSGLLEIHYINVGWGTSVLIIGPDGTTLLMDGGRDGMGTGHVIPYMESLGLMPADGLDYMLSSHLHSDHIDGLTEVLTHGYDVRYAIYYNGSDYSTQNVTAFRNAAIPTTAGPIRILPVGTVIQLGDGATATCVCGNGTVWGYGAVPGAQSDENDRSLGILIQYHNFDYLYAGDLGGGDADNSCTGRNTSQVNVETPLAQTIMPGGAHPLLNANGVEVLHVNHHGSESSTNPDYMNLLTPRFACIATGAGQSPDYMFPRHDVVDHVLRAGVYCITAPAATVVQSEEGDPVGSLTSYTGYCLGDFTFKTAGLANYVVDADGAVTEGPDERSALGLPLTVPLDEPPLDTMPPAVQVIAPNGGEVWDSQTQHNITWSATDSVGVTAYAIDYSTNSGTNWVAVQPQTSGNPGTFAWTIPPIASTNCLVRVDAWDGTGNLGTDISDAVFTITAPADTTAPVVHVSLPNGGEVWNENTFHNVFWTASDNVGVASYKIEYSTNSGSNWIVIQDWISGNPGNRGWTMPNTPSTQCLVKVSCRDADLNIGTDVSDNTFTIADPVPTVTVTAPNGGESWSDTSSHNITWTDGDNIGVTAYKLDYSTDGGSSWSNIQDWTDGDPHTFLWAIPNVMTSQARVRVSCRDISSGVGSDMSNNNFTIFDNVAPMVTVVSPNGGESYYLGDSISIDFSCDDNIGCVQANFQYSTNGGANWLLLRDWGSLQAPAWAPALTGSQYLIKVECRDAANNTASDISDNTFAVIDSTAPQVNLIHPNGGEVLNIGSTYNITWLGTDNAGVSAYKLEYAVDGGSNWIVIQDWQSGNPNTYPWTVPDTVSSLCLIEVSCRDAVNNIGLDISENYFSIDHQVGCVYILGDVNGNGQADAVDVTFAVNYLKGKDIPPIDCAMPVGPCAILSPFYAAGDVNGSCEFNGIDVTFFVNYLKGRIEALMPCPDCPPVSPVLLGPTALPINISTPKAAGGR